MEGGERHGGEGLLRGLHILYRVELQEGFDGLGRDIFASRPGVTEIMTVFNDFAFDQTGVGFVEAQLLRLFALRLE